MNVSEIWVMRISRQPTALRILTDKKQQRNISAAWIAWQKVEQGEQGIKCGLPSSKAQ